MTKLHDMANLGQSIWLDFIRRSFTESGQLTDLIERGLRGVTSNPSIFEQAIGQSQDYDDQLRRLLAEARGLREIYEALVIEDIQRACDEFLPLFEETDGGDGFVSLEVTPDLAHDAQATIEEVQHLWSAVERPNVMIKIPATDQGYPAIQEMIRQGVNINVTLMFSLQQYDRVAEAYLSGLEGLAEAGGDVSRVASVASFFVSRVDTKVDRLLDEIGETEIRGAIGIANAKLAYARFVETFQGRRWEALERQGARLQRVLWGSTSTKDPAYSDTRYVEHLIGPHTVNTVPPDTLEAFLDHGAVARTIDAGLDQAHQQIERLEELGFDLDRVTDELLTEGVRKFADSYQDLMDGLAAKCKQFRPGFEAEQAG